MPSQYIGVALPVKDSHYKDTTVSRPSYLYNGNLIPGKTAFILKQGPVAVKGICHDVHVTLL